MALKRYVPIPLTGFFKMSGIYGYAHDNLKRYVPIPLTGFFLF